ncbi:MAG: hypothetical protein R3Y06_12275 [Faecalibacterium sp.]
MNILEELYFENICPNSKTYDRNSDYGKAMQKLADCEETLLATLAPKEKAQLIAMVNAYSEVIAITGLENFISGFKLGGQIQLAIVSERNSCLKDVF